jgi:hypothetical protein
MGDLVQRMGDSVMEQVTGRDRSLLGGVVTAADADSASIFDMARHILGNPYEEHADDATEPELDEADPALDAVASLGDDDEHPGGTGPPFPA